MIDKHFAPFYGVLRVFDSLGMNLFHIKAKVDLFEKTTVLAPDSFRPVFNVKPHTPSI